MQESLYLSNGSQRNEECPQLPAQSCLLDDGGILLETHHVPYATCQRKRPLATRVSPPGLSTMHTGGVTEYKQRRPTAADSSGGALYLPELIEVDGEAVIVWPESLIGGQPQPPAIDGRIIGTC